MRNIAAYEGVDTNRANEFLWGSGILGSTVLADGIYVGLNPVPTSNSGWTNAPYEAQYLKLYDVTPPPTPSAPFSSTNTVNNSSNYAIGTAATFTWNPVTDPIGGISGYVLLVGTSPGASNVFVGNVGNVTNYTVTGAYGQTLYATLEAVNNALALWAVGLGWRGHHTASPNGDEDGQRHEQLQRIPVRHGSDELKFRFQSPFHQPSQQPADLVKRIGKSYQVMATSSLHLAPTNVGGVIPADGTNTSFAVPAVTNQMFYRVQRCCHEPSLAMAIERPFQSKSYMKLLKRLVSSNESISDSRPAV